MVTFISGIAVGLLVAGAIIGVALLGKRRTLHVETAPATQTEAPVSLPASQTTTAPRMVTLKQVNEGDLQDGDTLAPADWLRLQFAEFNRQHPLEAKLYGMSDV